MPRKRYVLTTMLLMITVAFAFGMCGCNTVKGFGQDISNAADTGEKLLNGEPIFYNRPTR